MLKILNEDKSSCLQLLSQVEDQTLESLVSEDLNDVKGAILEVRPGVGGLEAGLFASDIFDMYRKFADRNGWKFEPLSITPNDAGGIKEAVASISGTGVFGKLKFETGVHRVQRVPKTETGGKGTYLNDDSCHFTRG